MVLINNLITSLLLIATAIFGLYYTVVFFSNMNDDSRLKNQTTLTPEDFDDFECSKKVSQKLPCLGLAMTTRSEWLAQPPHNPLKKLFLPANRIIITDTKTEVCSEKPRCKYIVRSIQDNHILTSDDIEYNFLINSRGELFEGRGWLAQSDELPDDFRNDTYRIALIGNFTKEKAFETQLQGVQNFVKHAESIGKLNTAHSIYCSNDVINSNNNTYYTSKNDDQYKECLNKD